MPVISGTVFDASGNPVAGRIVRAYRRDTGALLAETLTSDGTTPPDPHWDKVVTLLHFDGDFSDVKGGAFQTAGTVTFKPGKFDHCMFLLSGSSGVAEIAPRVELDLPADFTIEGWMMPAVGTSGAFVSRFQTGSSSGFGWQIYLQDDGRLSFYHYAGSGSYPIGGVGPDVRDGNWHHVAVTREASLLRMFVDGVLVGTGSSSVSYTSAVALLSVGYQVQGGGRYPFRGSIDEVRITKGMARYTANFTPPTAPFPETATPLPLGKYEITTTYTGECNVICLDDSEGTTYNDLILRTIPA